MPVKRRQTKAKEHKLTPEAVEAFRAGAWLDLHRALGLKPWQASPLDADAPSPYPAQTAHSLSHRQAVELRAQLIDAAK